VHREARHSLAVQGAQEKPDGDTAHIGWVRGSFDALRPFSSGATHVNFITEDADDARIRAPFFGRHVRSAAQDQEDLRSGKHLPRKPERGGEQSI
jgi:hypothetical protein